MMSSRKPESIPVIVDLPARDPQFSFRDYILALKACVLGGSEPRFTVGLYGPWGSGKSTILDALQGSLNAEMDRLYSEFEDFREKVRLREGAKAASKLEYNDELIIPVRFEAWRHERAKALFPTLLELVGSEVENVRRKFYPNSEPSWYRNAFSMLRNVQHIAVAGLFEIGLREKVDGNSSTGASESVGDYAAAYRRLENFTSKDMRIVVLIDDLDRCSPNSVVDIIEAIRVFMDIPGFVFVLAVDYDVVIQAIQDRYQHVDAHRFIEKIVQVPFRIPVMQAEGNSAVKQLLPNWEDIQPQWFSDFDNTEYLDDVITLCLKGNPRQSKRLLNSYMIARHIKWGDFEGGFSVGGESMQKLLIASLTFQLCWPDVFSRFVETLVIEVNGQIPESEVLERTDAYTLCRDASEEDESFARFLHRFLKPGLNLRDVHKAVQLAGDVGTGGLEATAVSSSDSGGADSYE